MEREIKGSEVQVALQGTLETFALADVLRLLASTKKTGILRIDGDRGYGEMSVLDGELVGANATGAPRAERPAEVLFELLRYETGSFIFDGEGDIAPGEHRANVDEALADAEEQLREWREIEAVVPSPDRLVSLVAERDKDITLTARQWAAVVALGEGATTEALGERLGVAELPAARMVRDLVELGAVEIGDEESSLSSAHTSVVIADLETTIEPPTSVESLGSIEGIESADELDDPADEVSETADELSETANDFIDDDHESSLDDILAGATHRPDPLTPSSDEPQPFASAEPEAPAAFQPLVVPDPPPAPPAPAFGADDSVSSFGADDSAPSFADSPSLISEPSPPPPPPPPSNAPLFSSSEAARSAFAPADSETDDVSSSAFAAAPPPPPPAFAPASDPLGSWNDDDGLSSFHSDDEPVPLFDNSDSAPGPDDPFGPDPFIIPNFTSSPADAKEAEEAAELARQLANLSPRAQQAVAAAAAAGTDEERDQAIARAEAVSDEPINRSLLLKYLSSVDE